MADSDALDGALLRPSRRAFLGSAAAFVAWSHLPRAAYAGSRDPRLAVVILRGALDGLSAVPPIGDPDYSSLRPELASGLDGQAGTLPLDGFFALNSAMPALHRRYLAGEALLVHATATPYRERSHFDGQDVLENGTAGLRGADSGWLNRAVSAIPRGERVNPVSGLAASPTVPLVLRGPAPTLSWSPANLQPARADTAARLLDLYPHVDPELARVFQRGVELDAMTGGMERGGGGGFGQALRRLTAGSGRLLARPDGPRVAALSSDGWDTHFNQGPVSGRLARLLGALDSALEAMAAEMSPVWRDTVVLVLTEFGRTAHENGSDGTDHGTATTALLLGGAVRGGRVVADWPGLKPTQLYEGRDLAPTTDLRAVLKGVLRDHLGIGERELANSVFPGSIGLPGLDGLVA